MPGGDGTGPRGMGAMTGRGAGYCVGYLTPGYATAPAGGFGPGRGPAGMMAGRGRGWRHWYRATGLPGWARGARGFFVGPGIDEDAEKDFLRRQAESLQAQLDEIRRRLGDTQQKDSQA